MINIDQHPWQILMWTGIDNVTIIRAVAGVLAVILLTVVIARRKKSVKR